MPWRPFSSQNAFPLPPMWKLSCWGLLLAVSSVIWSYRGSIRKKPLVMEQSYSPRTMSSSWLMSSNRPFLRALILPSWPVMFIPLSIKFSDSKMSGMKNMVGITEVHVHHLWGDTWKTCLLHLARCLQEA